MRTRFLLLVAAALTAGCSAFPQAPAQPAGLRAPTSRVEVRVRPLDTRRLAEVQPEITTDMVQFITLVLYDLTGRECEGDKCGGQVGAARIVIGDTPPRYFDPIPVADAGKPIVLTDLTPGGSYRMEATAWSGLPYEEGSEDLTDYSSLDLRSVAFEVASSGVAEVVVPIHLKKNPFSGTAVLDPVTIETAPLPGIVAPAPSPTIDQERP